MTISLPPKAPDPSTKEFPEDALAFVQWQHSSVAQFNQTAVDVNAAKLAAQQAANDSGDARDAAITARGQAQGFATAAGVASGLAADERAGAAQERQQAEAARDSARAFAQAAGASVGIAPSLAAKPLANLRVNAVGTGLEATYDVPAGDVKRKSLTAAYTAASSDKGALLDCAGTWTLGFAAAATLGNGWWCYVRNTGAGVVTLDPAGAELVDGVATAPMPAGTTLLVTCDGTALNTLEIKRRRYDRRQLITSTGTFVVPSDVYVLRGYAVGAGQDGGVNLFGGAGGGMAYGDIAVKPGDVLNISIAAGVAKVSKSGTDLLIGNPPASRTSGGTATKHASVENGGAYSGGVSSNRGGASSGSPLGTGKSGGSGGGGWGGMGGAAGGGVGGNGESSPSNLGGPGLPQHVPITEPLLMGLTSSGAAGTGAGGGPGAGGSVGSNTGVMGGAGGFGGGGGGGNSFVGGVGGFGGGGGESGSGYTGGAGGYGGGGGSVSNSGAGGAGGAAAVVIIYG